MTVSLDLDREAVAAVGATLARRGRDAAAVGFVALAFLLRDAVPDRCAGVAYSAGVDAGLAQAAEGGMGGLYAGGMWGLCGLLYVESAIVTALVVGLGVVGAAATIRRVDRGRLERLAGWSR